jgi:hypothetical protein
VIGRGDDQVGDLRRQEAPQPADALDLVDLLGDAPFERGVPLRELARLVLDGVVQRLLAQHRAHPGEEGGVLEGLRQVVVAAGVESRDDVAGVGLRRHEDHRDRLEPGVALELAHDRDAVELRHHDVEEDQVRLELAGAGEPFLAVGCGLDLVAVRLEAHAQDLEVLRRVVDGEDEGRLAHGARPSPNAGIR